MEPLTNWNRKAFKKMTNLKTLIIENSRFSKGPKYLPSGLRKLEWKRFPSKSLSSCFSNKASEIISVCNCVHFYIRYKSIVSYFYLFVSYSCLCRRSSTT